MPMQTKLLVGTSKGLIIYRRRAPAMQSSTSWKFDRVVFDGFPVSVVYSDERTNTWWAALSHRHWGEKLHYSNDEGKSWKEVVGPDYKDHLYRPGKPASLKRIWSMHHAGVDRPGGLWLGTEPGGLFYSEDSGKRFQLVESLWNHPSRQDPSQWFGAGKDYPFLHSIAVDPRDSKHLYIGVSCAGVFETRDAGKSWELCNEGLIATYLPNPHPEVGHDPHRILICKSDPNILWQQNHCGIFRTTNGGKDWQDVSGPGGFPKYGFALAIDRDDPNTAWVIPAESDERRVPRNLSLTVCSTHDGGRNWISNQAGLPAENAFDLVLRHAFDKKENALVFGTNNGNLYASDNNGTSWEVISNNLPMVNYVVLA